MNITARIRGNISTLGTKHFILNNHEPRCNNHVVQFPIVRSIQPDICLHELHIFNLVSLQIYIVDRIILRLIAIIIVTSNIHQRITFTHSETDTQLRNIVSLVSNLKGHDMCTIVQRHSLHCRKGRTDDLRSDLYAVQIDLTSFSVQTNRKVVLDISNGSRETSTGNTRQYRAIRQRLHLVRRRIARIRDHRRITVRGYRAVIQGDIIVVENVIIVMRGRLRVEANEARLTPDLLFRILQRDIVVTGQVYSTIHPPRIRNIRLGHGIQRFSGAIRTMEANMALIGAYFISRASTIKLCLHSDTRCALRNVNPHGQCGCILIVRSITQDGLSFYVKEHVVAPIAIVAGTEVDLNTQRVVAILNLAIFLGRQEGTRVYIIREVTALKQVSALSNAVFPQPRTNSASAHPVGHVAIFEGPLDFGLLAKANPHLSASHVCMLVGGTDLDALHSFVGSRSQFKAIKGCSRRRLQDKVKAIRLEEHVIVTRVVDLLIRSNDLCTHIKFQRNRPAKGTGRFSLRKLHLLGINHMDSLEANNRFRNDDLNIHITQLTIGDEYTLLNGTKAFIRQRPSHSLRHLHAKALGINSLCLKGRGRVRGIVDVVAFHIGMIKNAAGHSVVNHKDRVNSSTLRAIARHATDRKIRIALTLGDEARGTATITVDRIDTTQGQHHLAQLVIGQTGGVVCTTSISHTQHQRAIGLDANHRTGSIRRGALRRRHCILAVLDTPSKVCRNNSPVIRLKLLGM